MKVRVNVTRRDIELGCRGRATACPVFRALKRITTSVAGVSGSYARMRRDIDGDYWGTAIAIPNRAANWIYDFDRGRKVSPIRFSMEIPDKYLKRCNRNAQG